MPGLSNGETLYRLLLVRGDGRGLKGQRALPYSEGGKLTEKSAPGIERRNKLRNKQLKWVWATTAAMIVLLAFFPAEAVEKQDSGEKAAVVNGKVILRADLDREMQRVEQQFASMGKQIKDFQLLQIKMKVLETLIARELLYQESQNKGVQIDDAALKARMKKIKDRFPSEEDFKNALSRANLNEDSLKSQIGRQLAIQSFIDEDLAAETTVSAKETREYYDNNPDRFRQPEKLRASHILIKVESAADETQKAEARKKLEEVQQKLEDGASFADLAREYSEGPSNSKGGDLGFFARGQMVPPFEEAAFAMEPGQVSDIVQTRFGYHLIKVVDKRPESKLAYAEVKDKLQNQLRQKKVQEEVTAHVEELKSEAEIERFLGNEAE
jgi:peptidyl-prolyl cis-trans isomerase C